MPHAPVNDEGAVLYYEDTGVPGNSTNYVTLVVVHGMVFHLETFRRIVPLASAHNLRLVRLNLRDYPGSTPWSQDEIDSIREKRESAKDIMAAMGQELGAFITWFISTENIPALSADADGTGRTNGGVSVLAWSLGNLVALSLLSHLEELSEANRDLLGNYIRSCVLLDPPCYLVGSPFPPLNEVYHPARDPDIPPAERGEAIMLWLSSYFDHRLPDRDLSSVTYSELVSGLAHAKANADVVPTIRRMSPEELTSVTDVAGAARAHLAIRALDTTIWEHNFRRALFNNDTWPELRVEYVWCILSMDECVFAAWYLAQIMGKGDNQRKFTAHPLKANHFPHWDEPETFIAYIAGIV